MAPQETATGTGGMLHDFLFILSSMLFVLGAAAKGYVSPQGAAGILIALMLLRALARARGKAFGSNLRRLFTVGLPLASFAMFAIDNGDKGAGGTMAIAGSGAALVLSLFGIWIMVRGLFGRP